MRMGKIKGSGLIAVLTFLLASPAFADALVDQFYADVQKMGGGRGDTSSLIRRLPK